MDRYSHRLRPAARTALAILGCLAAPLTAADWTYVGTSGFSLLPVPCPATGGVVNRPFDGYHRLGDCRRVILHSLVVDRQDNVFTTANGADGSPTGISIYRPDGSRTDVNLSAYPGYVTRLVLAGDGQVYALQNWVETYPDWPWSVVGEHRILQISVTSGVTKVFSAKDERVRLDPSKAPNGVPLEDRILGMTTASDGNLYWVMGGQISNFWKYRYLYRCVLTTLTVEANPRNPASAVEGIDNVRLQGLEWVGYDTLTGEDRFAAVGEDRTGLKGMLYADPISWSHMRQNGLGGTVSTPGWDRVHSFGLAYDAMHKRLWVGPTAVGWANCPPTSDPPGQAGTCIMTRFAGDTQTSSLFSGNPTDALPGSPVNWHANNNDPSASGVSNGGPYWVTTIAVNQDGTGWYAFGGQILNNRKCADGNYNGPGSWGAVGHVYTCGLNDAGTTGDQGRPMDALPTDDRVDENQVVGLTFNRNRVYALVADLVNGKYHLFAATGATPCNWPPVDADGDADVDMADFAVWQRCLMLEAGQAMGAECGCLDRNMDGQITAADLAVMTRCFTGSAVQADPNCGR